MTKKCKRCGCEIEDIDGYNYCDECMDLKLKREEKVFYFLPPF